MITRLYRFLALTGAMVLGVPALGQSSPPLPPEDELPIAYLVDVTSGQVLFQRNENRRFVPASITKVMTLYHAFELIEEGTLDPRDTMAMTYDIWREWNGKGSTMWIDADAEVAVDDLLAGIANVSANDASILLAQTHAGSVAAWTQAMTQRAHALGMTQSRFGTPNGWPDEGYTFTTAKDLVTLAEAMIRRHPGKYARYIGRPGFRYNGIAQDNRDPLTGRFEGADGIKTGYTNESGLGYLGSAERNGQRLVMVVAGAYRNRVRNGAARDLMEWGFAQFERKRLYGEGETVGIAKVQAGGAMQVELRSDRTVFVNVPRGRASEMQLSIRYNGPVRAPIAEGSRIASLVVEAPGMEPAIVPLLAAEAVPPAGFLDRIRNAIVGWFE